MEQVIDLVELEEKYGAELVERLKARIDQCVKEKWNWKLEITQNGKYTIRFAFASNSFVWVYEVRKKSKTLEECFIVGSVECRKYLEIMDSL